MGGEDYPTLTLLGFASFASATSVFVRTKMVRFPEKWKKFLVNLVFLYAMQEKKNSITSPC